VTILHIDSSINGENSASRAISARIVEQLQPLNWGEKVVYRDLAAEPLAHLTLDAFGDTSVLDEFLEADTVVIGAPMYNFGIASTLKTWFDYVLRAGMTFRYGESGLEGLLKGKRAIVILSRGGLYSEGPAQAMDSQEPHLRTLLGFTGITDVTFVRAEKLAFGPEIREQTIGAARARLGHVIQNEFARAA
jgi:FMN-dependent NADH-azoreductase